MSVLYITVFVSLCLAGIFVVCFAVEATRRGRSNVERDSLLPLDDSDGHPVETETTTKTNSDQEN